MQFVHFVIRVCLLHYRGLMFVSESTSLRILQVQAFHAGLYRCQGRRIFGTPPCVYFSENATITVQGKFNYVTNCDNVYIS